MNSCTDEHSNLKLHKVVWQQIWCDVADFIPISSAVHLRMQEWKKNQSTFDKVITKRLRECFSTHGKYKANTI